MFAEVGFHAIAIADFEERFDNLFLGDYLRQSPGAAAEDKLVRSGEMFVNLFKLLYCCRNWFVSWGNNFCN